MIQKNVNRRMAMIGLTSSIAGCVLSPLLSSAHPSRFRTQPPGPLYVEPTWWDDKDPMDKKWFLPWDLMFWSSEQLQPAPATPPSPTTPFNTAGAILLSAMSQVGGDDMKARFAVFIADSHRFSYLPHLLPGLDPASANQVARLAVVGAMQRGFETQGAAVFTTQMTQALLSRYAAEPDPYVQSQLDQVLTDLNIPH